MSFCNIFRTEHLNLILTPENRLSIIIIISNLSIPIFLHNIEEL